MVKEIFKKEFNNDKTDDELSEISLAFCKEMVLKATELGYSYYEIKSNLSPVSALKYISSDAIHSWIQEFKDKER
ncbi:MAG: hypothetical protein LBD03_08760 [Methanobrevibacter sp.]|jgi:hypothetical protein|nr:hypothetical protein [Candidatus Methanovirga procula]